MPAPFFTFSLIFLATLAILLLGAGTIRTDKAVLLRLDAIRNPRRSHGAENQKLELSHEHAKGLAGWLGVWLRPYRLSSRVETLLIQSGSSRTVGEFALISVGCGSVAGAVIFLLSLSLEFSLIGSAGCLFLPWSYVVYKRHKRLHAVLTALPDASDLMARSLRAGHSLTQAIEILGIQAPVPLAAEFARVFQQQSLGIPLRDVLEVLGNRVPSRDLHFLITAIRVQRETGGDLAEILERTANLLRERIRVKGEVKVHTAQGRLTGWILSLLPLGLLTLLSIFSPGYTGILFHDPFGRNLLYGGAGLIAVGALLIHRITRVDL